MKKKMFLCLLALLLCVGLCGCTNEKIKNKKSTKDNSELSEPVINWKQVSELPSGNWLLMEIKNPNKVAIDFSYDIEFYDKNNKILSSLKNLKYSSLYSKDVGLIYSLTPENLDINLVNEIKVKLNYNKVTDIDYIDYELNEVERQNNEIPVSIRVNDDFTKISEAVLFYKDKKIVQLSTYSFFQKDGSSFNHVGIVDFDDYKVYINAK